MRSPFPNERTKKPMNDASQIDTGLVRTLADLFATTGLAEMSLSKGDLRIRMTRAAPSATAEYAIPPQAAPPAPSPVAIPAAPIGDDTVYSPMVGTARHGSGAASAGAVAVGTRVEAGDRLLVIEAMRTLTEIVAQKAGTIKAILVGNGQPVEYGQPLLVIA
jgi:acetyl-CoA carboxylase biotin carboxyl carrier protein